MHGCGKKGTIYSIDCIYYVETMTKKPDVNVRILPLHISVAGGEAVLYIGEPKSGINPAYYQAKYYSNIPSDVMNSLEQLHGISEKNHTSLVDLCRYALESGGKPEQDVAN